MALSLLALHTFLWQFLGLQNNKTSSSFNQSAACRAGDTPTVRQIMMFDYWFYFTLKRLATLKYPEYSLNYSHKTYSRNSFWKLCICIWSTILLLIERINIYSMFRTMAHCGKWTDGPNKFQTNNSGSLLKVDNFKVRWVFEWLQL